MDQFEQRRYIKSRGIYLPNGQVFLKQPLFVYKKVYTYFKDRTPHVLRALSSSNLHLYSPVIQANKRIANVTKLINGRKGEEAIANLIIPVGSLVNLPQDSQLKMRSNQAIVHSIIRNRDKNKVAVAVSGHDNNFGYLSASYFDKTVDVNNLVEGWTSKYNNIDRPDWMNTYTVVPELPFNTDVDDCDSGIHFFLESETALNY